MPELSEDGKEQVALALLLLKDFKRQECPEDDMDITLGILKLAKHLGVYAQFQAMMPKVPPMRITPRDK